MVKRKRRRFESSDAHRSDVISSSLQNPSQIYEVLAKTIAVNEEKSMPMNETRAISTDSSTRSTGKTKRAQYMSELRGARDSEYRRIERENNARAMRRKRLEDPAYREHERRQNRLHMAELRRVNAEYREREHLKNRHRMALKRGLAGQNTTKIADASTNIDQERNTSHSIYQTLENNLQAAHISFIPYQTSSTVLIDAERENPKKPTNEYDILRHVDEYCREEEETGLSNENSSSRSVSSSC